MKSLALRKQLLIEESEINRAWQATTGEVQSLVRRAGTISSMVSLTAAVLARLACFRHQKSAPAAEKPSWLQTLLKGAGVLATVWQAFRPQDHTQKDQ
jgi:hypothetical protein